MDDYDKAWLCFLGEHWDELRQKLHIPDNWWNTILEGICKTDEFYEVIERIKDVASAFEELDQQLAILWQYTPIPAPYTGDKAIEALRDGELLSWETIATVMLHYPTMDGEVNRVKTYCWSHYRLEWPPHVNKAAHAVALDPPFKTAMHLRERQRETEILDAFETRQSRNLGRRMCSSESFLKVLKYVTEKEVRGQHMYTKFSDVFSLNRGQECPKRTIKDSWKMIATIVLDHGKFEYSPTVDVWTLGRNTRSGKYGHNIQCAYVYSTAASFYKARHWDGLRKLFDIDDSWWDKLLRRLCQQQSFGDVLNKLKEREAIGEPIYPQFNNIFSWTRVPECKPEDVKVIIVGQDPLRSDKATGMSFLLVKKGKCKSIKNIFRSVKGNFGIKEDINHLCPYSWCQQGVLLLNTQMTIGKSARHTSIGWEQITTEILEYFIDCQKHRSLHILLWSSYWTREPDGELRGDDRPIEKLRKKVSGKRTRVIHNTHPSPRNDNRFVNETAIEKKLFKEEVTTVGWTTIRDGMPFIPAGVIHTPIVHGLSKQLAELYVAIQSQPSVNQA